MLKIRERPPPLMPVRNSRMKWLLFPNFLIIVVSLLAVTISILLYIEQTSLSFGRNDLFLEGGGGLTEEEKQMVLRTATSSEGTEGTGLTEEEKRKIRARARDSSLEKPLSEQEKRIMLLRALIK